MGLCCVLCKNKWRSNIIALIFCSLEIYVGIKISAAMASDSRKRDILVINEALRLQMMPELDEIKEKSENIKTIEQAIRVIFT